MRRKFGGIFGMKLRNQIYVAVSVNFIAHRLLVWRVVMKVAVLSVKMKYWPTLIPVSSPPLELFHQVMMMLSAKTNKAQQVKVDWKITLMNIINKTFINFIVPGTHTL